MMKNKSKRIIAYMDGDFWVEPFKKLSKEGHIELRVVFAVLPALMAPARKEFQDASFLSADMLKTFELSGLYKNSDNGFNDMIGLYQYLTSYDQLITSMTKRDNYAVRIRGIVNWRIHYYKIIEGLVNMISAEKPDIIFFSEIPHNYGSYLLYQVARYFEIRTLMMVMPIELKGRIYVTDGIEDGNKLVLEEYSAGKNNLPDNIILSDDLEANMLKIKQTYAAAKPVYVKKYIESGKTRFMSLRHLKRMLRRRNYGVNLRYNIIQRGVRRLKMIIWHRQLPSFYRDLCSDINLTDRYIYFALHYQPEQTSLPMAGIFENQYMTISLLSRFLPSDWYIYVKENPYQFLNMDPHQRDFKSKLFYKTVSELPGVKLIPMRYNSFELIDHSQAVATLTGMTGWEAINRGKPVLCFGYSSYRNNDGVFHINSDIDLLNAINRLENGSLVPDIKKIRFYVSLLYKHTSPGVVKNFEYDVYGINKETNSQSWYSEILKSL